MTDKKTGESRRKLLKSIAAGSGAIVAGKSLPESWRRPVVDSVLLPAHAQTSTTLGGNYTAALTLASLDIGNTVLATLVSDAHANGISNSLCVEVTGSSFRFGFMLGSISNPDAIYKQDGGTVGGGILWTGGGDYCGETPDEVGVKISKVDGAGAHYELYFSRSGSLISSGILPSGMCPWDPTTATCK